MKRVSILSVIIVVALLAVTVRYSSNARNMPAQETIAARSLGDQGIDRRAPSTAARSYGGFVPVTVFITGDPAVSRNGALYGASWDESTEIFMQFRAGFSDREFVINNQESEPNTVITSWRLSGNHTETFQGIPATGARVSMTGITTSRFVEGSGMEYRTSYGRASVATQLGVMSASEKEVVERELISF